MSKKVENKYIIEDRMIFYVFFQNQKQGSKDVKEKE